MTSRQQITRMRERITDEIFFALGLRKIGILRRLFGWIFYLPTSRFARIFATADEEVNRFGLSAGCRSVIKDLAVRLQVRGVEHIPVEGPLLVISNHPGAYDSAAIGSCVRRSDLKIIVYETGFYRVLPHIKQWLIYATEDPSGRMLALRNAIRHLEKGGSILQFGSGTIDPDPDILPGAEAALDTWSPSIEIMLRKVPETQVVLDIASGVLLRQFAYHPFTRIHHHPINQRRLAEFMQVIQQLVLPRTVKANARLSFATAASTTELAAESNSNRLFPAILERAHRLLAEHLVANDFQPA